MPQLLEITAVYLGEKIRRDSWFVGQARALESSISLLPAGSISNPFPIVGNAEPDELKPQLEYRFYGSFERNGDYGPQFKFKTFVRSQPHGRGGVIRYLCEAPGIGEATATALWNKFQSDAVRILRESPDVAQAAVTSSGGRQFTLAKAATASEFLQEQAALENCTIDLIDLLSGRGFPRNTAREATKVWGNKAAAIIQSDPFKLLRFRGCGFLRCDALWLALGIAAGKAKRQAHCVRHIVASDTAGHTWHPISKITAGLKERISGATINPVKAVKLARRAKLVVTRWSDNDCPNRCGGENPKCPACYGTGGRLWIADGKKAKSEDYLARHIAAALNEQSNWPSLDHPAFEPLTPHQREQLALAISGPGPIGILTGLAGTGKTFTVACLERTLLDLHGTALCAVVAPTGKAAVRATEAMAEYKLPLAASTIHRFLIVESAEDGWSFHYGDGNPVPHKFISGDEQSMSDTTIMASFFAARAPGTHILLIGDTTQLAPVGHGAPLRDLIAAGVPCGKLTEIKRNAGTIVRASKEIASGNQRFQVDEVLNPDADPPQNLILVPASRESAPQKVLELVRKIKQSKLADPVWDLQVIVAVNKRSTLSRVALSKQLQAELNPNGATVAGSPFRVGDKVIQLKNGFLKLELKDDDWDCGEDGISLIRPQSLAPDVVTNPKGQVFVANGELGKILSVETRKTIVQFTGGRRVVIPRGASGESKDNEPAGASGDSYQVAPDAEQETTTGCDLDLAYAVSCHKMQGSECRIVIVCLDEYPGASGAFGVCDRSWIYTAFTRAKEICIAVGKRSTAAAMIGRNRINDRKTFLKELIEKYRAEIESKQKALCASSGRQPAGKAVSEDAIAENGNPAAEPSPPAEFENASDGQVVGHDIGHAAMVAVAAAAQ